NSPMSLTAAINILATAAAGPRTLTITTGSDAVSLNNAFTVNRGTPVLASVSPNTGKQGEKLAVTITGQYTTFGSTTQVSFGTGITVATVAVSSGTSLTAQLDIGSTAPVGSRDVTVTTGSESVVLTDGFSITRGTPR